MKERYLINKRIKDKVCNGCGGKLSVRTLRENSCFTGHKEVKRLESVCMSCNKLCYGVDRKDYLLAKKVVMESGYIPYEHLKKDMWEHQSDEKWMKQYYIDQISGAYGLIEWFKKALKEIEMGI